MRSIFSNISSDARVTPNEQAQHLLSVVRTTKPIQSPESQRTGEIDALSTLGGTAVCALLEDPRSPVSSWPDGDRALLERFTVLRTASEKGIDVTPTPEEIPLEFLPDTYTHHLGTLPILVTAPHEGRLTVVGNRQLVKNAHSVSRDGGSSYIARDIRAFLLAEGNEAPPVLVDNVSRAYRTPQTRAYFEGQTFRVLRAMRAVLATDAPLLHLDIHAFGPKPETDAFDLIFGTGHRHTLGSLDADKELASFMRDHGYAVRLPTTTLYPDEHFTSDYAGTLAQRVRAQNIPHTGSIQIEIHRKFRTQEGKPAGQQLARDLGAFCLRWSKN